MGNWNYVSSLVKPMSPVSDNRWEDFKEEKISNQFRAITVLPNIGSFSVSIRGTTDAHFALCNKDNTSNFCFFIILGGWKNTKSIIRKCENGIPESASKIPSGDCQQALVSTNSIVLSSKKWKTFIIKWDFETQIALSVYESSTRLLNYSAPKENNYFTGHRRTPSANPEYFLFARTQVQLLMRFHIYDYLLTTTTQSKLISPETISLDKNMCIEMSISLCKKCFITVDFVDRNGKRKAVGTFQNKSSNNFYNLPIWQKVKINTTLSKGMQLPIKMEINTLLGNVSNKNNSYWAVSNIHRCYDGALKIVKINAHQDYNESSYFWPIVTCQKLSSNGVSTIIESTDHDTPPLNTETRSHCTEGKIGPSCSVNCTKLFNNNNHCHKLLACDEDGCFCAQGFTIKSVCSERCPNLKYGFECLQTCGNCADDICSFTTGECKSGCRITKNKLFIPPYCKIGIGAPPPPGIDLINSTCARLYLDVQKEYKIIPTSVNFQIWTNSTIPAFVSKPISVQRTTVTIQTHVDGLYPGTRYKLAGLIRANNRTFRGESINFTTPCTESVALNFVISSNETSITLNNLVDVHVNDTCPYTWYRVQLFSENKKLFDESTTFPKIFKDLNSFSHYKVVVLSERSTIINKIVNTLEGAPSPVKNLHVVSSSIDQINITWNSPDKIRGKLVNYTVGIQLVESRGCSDLDGISYNLTFSNIAKRFHMKDVITNTSNNTFNYVFKNLMPYTVYLITVQAYTSRHAGEKTELLYETASIDLPTEIFTNFRFTNETSSTIAGYLRWNPPDNCSTITGSILACKLFFKNRELTTIIVNNYYYPLEKSVFNGAQLYDVQLYALRDFYHLENKTAYTTLNFEMPARAPPPIRNPEIVEVDILNKTMTIRWNVPITPTHGQLDHYSIIYCKHSINCNETSYVNVSLNEIYKFDNFEYAPYKTLPLPSDYYDEIQITAYNTNVMEPSEPAIIPIRRVEFVPYAPQNLTLTIVSKENSTINVSWSHPLKSGGRLEKFTIKASVESSLLKVYPWHDTFIEVNVTNYQMLYNMNINLFPSTVFVVNVRAVTVGGLLGYTLSEMIIMPMSIKFSTEELSPYINDDLTVVIRVPEVIYDVKDSILVAVVEGPKYCDEKSNNNGEVKLILDLQSSSYYKTIWKAAMIKARSYANKELKIGDGNSYNNLKNYALCSKESYIIHLVLCQLIKHLNEQNIVTYEWNTLKSIKTNVIHMGEIPKNYAMWLIPLLFIILISMLLAIVLYRKKLTSRFTRTKAKVSQHEHMPLTNHNSNNIRNNLLDKSEKGMHVKDIKEIPHNNILKIDNKCEFIMPVKIINFEKYFESAYQSGALIKEYSSIKSGAIFSCTYGSQSEMKSKNRYANLFPYDETRVVLEKIPDDEYSDYINASYIMGYGGNEKAYIATQGPKPNTVIDFWRMICQEKVQIICMMANIMENGKIKCEQYWPTTVGKQVLYGKILIHFSSEEVHSDYTYRTFQISCENEETRTIEHLHYTAWPDHGVPSNPKSIVAFLKEIQKHSPVPRKLNDPPIVVHCSAGVGRTGTLIVLDMSIYRAYSENVVDIYANVLSARKQRLNMVDNAEQYLLVHLVLVEYLYSKNLCLTCDKTLPEAIAIAKKNSSEQYQRIVDTSWWNEILSSPPLPEKSILNKNRAKHRFPESAGGFNRLYLKRSSTTDEDSDYIAATSVKGIFKNCHYITTQLPMPSTFADFWRMLSEQNIELVIVLQLPDLHDSTYCELVPENQGFGNTKYIKVIRQEHLTVNSKYYLQEEVLIIDSSEQPSKEQFVKIISYKNWPESSLPSTIELVHFWKFLEELIKTEKFPIVTVCRNGVTVCGIWLALSFLLKRMSIDNECDVTQAVRVIQRCRIDFLNKPEYLEYLYDVALAWASNNENNN
ncbi:PREDICTED: receptor-type tyrosine-protein phosphatase T-like [Ceratosolen solmsi marchali]|uniref:protein-tyrosine-phosphatase n=1 Tax=Ceratosolen solmsi marchali TaxID=326594 RepID=A0AAJ7DZM5_9HYME|nr:PREDICTED: receptor-type tyrosine-protein phosphatase T-like [Ceratosolen solmsi marchali]